MLLLAGLCVPASAAQKAKSKLAESTVLANVAVAPDLDERL